MSFEKLLYVLMLAWAAACLYYLWKINRIARANGFSVFSAAQNRTSRSIRTIIRRLYVNIIVITIFFLIVIILAYFVSQSS